MLTFLRALQTGLPVFGDDDLSAQIRFQLCGKCLTAFRPARVHADLVKISEGFERARTLARVDGEPAIVFILLKADGADAVLPAEQAREKDGHVEIGVFVPSLGLPHSTAKHKEF